jgi:hypothetical protein
VPVLVPVSFTRGPTGIPITEKIPERLVRKEIQALGPFPPPSGLTRTRDFLIWGWTHDPHVTLNFFRGRERDFSNSENADEILPHLIEGRRAKTDPRFLSPVR